MERGGVYVRAQDSVRKAGLAERWVRLDVLLVRSKTLWDALLALCW